MAKAQKTEIKLIRSAMIAARRLRQVFESQKIYVSNAPLSVVPYMFLRKAFHVHEAVMTLCKADMPSEAYALSRVLIEMFIALRWITNENQSDRAEEYAFFVTKRKEYWAGILEKYHPSNPQSAGAMKHVKSVYGEYLDKYSSSIWWSHKKLRAMSEELERLDPATEIPPDVRWDYEVPYSMASDHVHATVAALEPLVPAQASPIRFRECRTPS